MATSVFLPRDGSTSVHPHLDIMGGFPSRGHTSQRDSWTPPGLTPKNCSVSSLTNARYHLDAIPMSDHPNEDRHFSLDGGTYQVFGVFDGHDGPRAAGFASNYMMELFNSSSWKRIHNSDVPIALREFFTAADKDFFLSIKSSTDEKERLQAMIPPVCTLTQMAVGTVGIEYAVSLVSRLLPSLLVA